MEIMYLLVLFVAPGMIVKKLRDYILRAEQNTNIVYDYLFDVIIDSLVVAAISIKIYCAVTAQTITGINEFAVILGRFNEMWKYIVIIAAISIVWCCIKNIAILKGMLRLKNWLLRKQKKEEHSNFATTWDAVMADEGINDTWQVVSLYKDDKYITSGMICSHSGTSSNEFELRLEHKEKVESLRGEHPGLFKTWFDYYNTTTGLRVVFYQQDIIEEHWRKHFPY